MRGTFLNLFVRPFCKEGVISALLYIEHVDSLKPLRIEADVGAPSILFSRYPFMPRSTHCNP